MCVCVVIKGVEASVDGVLGGYGHVNDADIIGSEVFLKTLLQERLVNVGPNQHLVALGNSLLSLVFIGVFFHMCVLMNHSNHL